MLERQTSYALPAPVQGRDSVTVEPPAAELWPLIADSTQLTQWGSPVIAVEVLDHGYSCMGHEIAGGRGRPSGVIGPVLGWLAEHLRLS